MAWRALGSGENGAFGGFYKPVTGGSDSIVNSPMPFSGGAYAYEIDPVNGVAVTELYGWEHFFEIGDGVNPDLLCIPFVYRYTGADFDAQISIAELSDGINLVRGISQTTSEAIQLIDADEDEIGITGNAYVQADTNYWMCWYFDRRSGGPTTRDILWIWDPVGGAWDKVVDVRGHSDSAGAIAHLTFGTRVGKGLPTVGGPFYVDEMGACLLNVAPATPPLGSLEVRYLIPDGDGADQDFDTGAPDWNDVKEIPHDGAASIDAGDAVGEQVSYTLANPGAAPLALQTLGVAASTFAGIPALGSTMKLYLLESGARDYGTVPSGNQVAYEQLTVNKTYNEVNGNPITEALVNGLEIGAEMVVVTATTEGRLTQIGLEWMQEGTLALPDDFPGSLVVPTRPMRPLIGR